MKTLVLVILHRREEEKRIKQQCKGLQATFSLDKYQIIRKQENDAYFNIVYEKLSLAIEHTISTGTWISSLSAFVRKLKEHNNVEVDDKHCYTGQMAANSILNDIDHLNAQNEGTAKSAILPCQSDFKVRQEIVSLDKELCRQTKLKLKENVAVQNYSYGIKRKMWMIQLNQLQNPMSETFKYFLICMLGLSPVNRKYFLQCLKLGLNERSVQQLQPLYDEYEKC